MANYNKVILVGNLTRDPQMRYHPSQMPVTEFGLAVNHKFKTKTGEDREEVLFIDCTAFGRAGEIINQYCQKGKQILVEGRLKYDTWEDKQGGGKRSKHSVVVDNFQFLGGGRDAGGGGGGGGGYSSGDAGDDQTRAPSRPPANRAPQGGGNRPAAQRPPQQSAPPPEHPFGDEPEFKEDDIPF
jgi:single-strand DNA-binding protein